MGADFPKHVFPIVIFTGKLSAELSMQAPKVLTSQTLLITSGNSGCGVQLLFSVLFQVRSPVQQTGAYITPQLFLAPIAIPVRALWGDVKA